MNAHGALLDAWMSLLEGNVTGFAIYRVDVPENESGNYVVVRPEGGSSNNNKRSLADEMVVVVDIVTIFENNANGSVVDGADDIIYGLVKPTATGCGLRSSAAMRIIDVNRDNFDYLQEADGTKVYYRKVSRYSHLLAQTA